MFTTTTPPPHMAGGDLLSSSRKASTASELLALFGAQQTPDSVTKSNGRTPSATPASLLLSGMGRLDDYPAGSASPYTTSFSPFSTSGSLQQHDVLFGHKEHTASTVLVPAASCSYGMDKEQQREHESQRQRESISQTELDQSDVLRDNSMYPDYLSEEPFRHCGLVRGFPQVGQSLHSSHSKAKPFDHPSSINRKLRCENSGVALDPAPETMYGIVDSHTSTIEVCIEPTLMAKTFQTKSSQSDASNVICLSSPLGKDELSTSVNPKNDVLKLTTPRPTPSHRNNARKGPHTNKLKTQPAPRKAKSSANSGSLRLFVPARRYGIRKPPSPKPMPTASSNHLHSVV